MKLYTRTGDAGETGLYGGERVRKDHERVRAYGAIDEANSAVGIAAAAPDLPPWLRSALQEIMSDLFDVGAELSTPAAAAHKLDNKLDTRVDHRRIAELERAIDEVEAEVPPLQTFVLPSGTDAAARLHFARTVVRRAEREIIALTTSVAVRGDVIVYVNRLSDLLFAWARLANHRAGTGDVAWSARKTRQRDGES
jgi:cob(I)alamin adenosyltransferase